MLADGPFSIWGLIQWGHHSCLRLHNILECRLRFGSLPRFPYSYQIFLCDGNDWMIRDILGDNGHILTQISEFT